MKVVIINGSPRKNGNTSAAVGLVSEELAKAGIDSEVLNIGGMEIRGSTTAYKTSVIKSTTM